MTSLHKLLLGCFLAPLLSSTASAQPATPVDKGLNAAVVAAYEELQGVPGGLVVVRQRSIYEEMQQGPSEFFSKASSSSASATSSSATSSGAPFRVFSRESAGYALLPLNAPWRRQDQVQFMAGPEAAQLGLPGFSFETDMLAKPPAVGVPFCLVFQGGLRNVGLQQLTDLDNLVHLSMLDTEVTDEGLANLAGLKNLTSLHLRDRRQDLGGFLQKGGFGKGGGGAPFPVLPDPADGGGTKKGRGTGGGGPGVGGPAGGKQKKGGGGPVPGGFGRVVPGGVGGNVTDAGLKEIGKLTNLTSLTLECPAVTGDGLKELAGLKNLTYLQLSIRTIGEDGLKTIAGFKNLKHLKITSPGVQPSALAELAPLKKLTTLELGSFFGRPDDTMRALRKIGLLHVLPYAEGKDGVRPKSSEEVVSMDLSGGGLSESSLRELADLTNLRVLNLNNQFNITDAGLRDLVWVKNLTSLDVRGTQATGSGVAALLPSLPNLTTLNIDSHMLNDECLRGLRESGLLHTIPFIHDRDGRRPKSALEAAYLFLGSTQVTNAGLKELTPLKNLAQLDLRSSRINDVGLKDLATFTNLQTLDLTHSGVTGSGLKYLASLEKLTTVHLNPEIVTNATLKDLLAIKGLGTLDLRQTRVNEVGFAGLAKAAHLQRIRLNPSQVTGGGLRVLREVGKLHLLDLAWAEDFEVPKTPQDVFLLRLSGAAIDDAALKELAGFSNLAVLYLDKTHVTDAGLADLASLKNLASLHLDGTPVTDAGLAHLPALKQLSTLYLKNTRVTSAGMKHLAQLENLSELSLASTKVTDSGLKQLASLKHLAQVFLEDTSVTDVGVAQLRRALPNCQVSRITLPRLAPTGMTPRPSSGSSSKKGSRGP